MKLDHIIFKTMNKLGFIVAGGLGSHSIYNLTQGNYQFAAIEGLTSLLVGISSYIRKKDIKFLYETIPQLVEEAKEMIRDCNNTSKNLYINLGQKIQ